MPNDRADDRRLAALDRMIEGRLDLINRLFDEVRELTAERERLAGRSPGLPPRPGHTDPIGR